MAKVNPFLKKATGTSKAPVALDKKKHGLGRSVNFGGGVGSLLGAAPVVPAAVSQILELKINDIERSPYQPRRDFREDELRELAESLKNNGLVQPPTVRKLATGKYELIAGERRLRAAQLAGWAKIRVTLVEADDQTAAIMTTTENLQREDLNPIEEAVSASGQVQPDAAGSGGEGRQGACDGRQCDASFGASGGSQATRLVFAFVGRACQGLAIRRRREGARAVGAGLCQ